MKIAVVGLGYVGLAVLANLVEEGHDVLGVDNDSYRIAMLENGKLPINEPSIEKIINKNKDKITYQTRLFDVTSCEVVFVCVGTPEGEEWATDMRAFNEVRRDLIKYVGHNTIIIVKSTVPVGTCKTFQYLIDKNRPTGNIKVVFSPEFLRQGHAYEDVKKPSRIVFGMDKKDENLISILESMFCGGTNKIVYTDYNSAELAKYSSNAFLALKITYMNEISGLANKTHANMNDVKEIMSLDKRINPDYLNAGIGFGGGCFVKDTKSLVAQLKAHELNPRITKALVDKNNEQNKLFLTMLERKDLKALKNKKILFVGVSFKVDSADMRNSIALANLKTLERSAKNISLYDPIVDKNELDKLHHKIYESLDEAIEENDVILIYNEIKDLNKLDDEYFENKYVFDGRNVLEQSKIKETKFYFSPALGEIKKR